MVAAVEPRWAMGMHSFAAALEGQDEGPSMYEMEAPRPSSYVAGNCCDVEASRETERRKSGRRPGAPSATGVDRYQIVEVRACAVRAGDRPGRSGARQRVSYTPRSVISTVRRMRLRLGR